MKFVVILMAFVLMMPITAVEYKKDIFPVLQKYCIKCHGNKKEKSDINFEKLSLDLKDSQTLGIWHEVLQVVNTEEMPPEDEKQMRPQHLDLFAGWLTEKLEKEKKTTSAVRRQKCRPASYGLRVRQHHERSPGYSCQRSRPS